MVLTLKMTLMSNAVQINEDMAVGPRGKSI
jgi:hypothetical protein